MSKDDDPDVRLALLELRMTRLEDDRKWVLGAAWGGLVYIATQLLPHIPMLLKGVGK
jgi:hypothetical protein